MKKIIVFILVFLLLATGCGKKDVKKTETPHIIVDGICVDDSYKDDADESLRMVYLFYTLNSGDQNLEIDSKYTELIFEETNTYSSEHYPGVCKYMGSYYYSSYIEKVYLGSTIKVVATLEIPEAELVHGRKITIRDNQLPDEEELLLLTDDIQHFNSVEEIAKVMDPTAYAEEMQKREPADSSTTEMVKNLLNGYYWSFYVNFTSYKLEFSEPNTFSVTTSLGSNSGTYLVKKGYIVCTYPSTGNSVEIPYEIKEEKIELDAVAAFDVKEN